MRETSPVWIKFYQEKRERLIKKIDKLDPDSKYYWKHRLKIHKELERIDLKIGV